ncbi:hypothetical protein EDD41_2431 [Luteococcus japonicus]|uniref:DUF2971 family protein n=1 Tax=Luteococcus japonicus TaxID=33984 RepID=A0A3N1ZWE8_9ACTN|nr:hypothetical protein EDD41_2431 [Luteococcus japonicus]
MQSGYIFVPPLYHYTDTSGFMGIIESGSLWATRASFLNDTRGFSAGREAITQWLIDELPNEAVRKFSKLILDLLFVPRIGDSLFISSLSVQGDRLSQWRAYAPTCGYCLEFDLRASPLEHMPVPVTYVHDGWRPSEEDGLLPSALRESFHTIASEYFDSVKPYAHIEDEDRESAREEIAKHLQEFIRTDEFVRMVASAATCKDNSFTEEEEWRIILFPAKGRDERIRYRKSPLGLTPYIPIDISHETGRLPLRSVTIGPGPEIDLRCRTAKEFLYSHGYTSTPVRPSASPLRV